VNFTVHHYHHADREQIQKLDAILHKLGAIMATIQQVLDTVTQEQTDIASMNTFITQLELQLAGVISGNLPPDVQAKVDQIFVTARANDAAILKAITTVPAPTATTTTVVSSQSPIAANNPVTFTATVKGANPKLPTGTVVFTDGTSPAPTVLGTGTVDPLTGIATVVATFTAPAADHSISAVYSGDVNNLTSTGSVTQTVSGAPATVPPPTVAPSTPKPVGP
jgi:hypothetical protein